MNDGSTISKRQVLYELDVVLQMLLTQPEMFVTILAPTQSRSLAIMISLAEPQTRPTETSSFQDLVSLLDCHPLEPRTSDGRR